MRSFDIYALTWALLLTSHVKAMTMRICTDELPPYTSGAADGTADRLILEAASEVGLTMEYHSATLARCREELRLNLVDSFPTGPYSPSVGFAVYPMKGTVPDIARAVLIRRVLVFRRVGSPAEWSGTVFSKLTTPVLVQFGADELRENVKTYGVRVDDGGKSVGINFAKMLAGRAELAVAPELSGLATIKQPPYAGQIEALPTPFKSQPYYLIISKQFYQANTELVQRLWDGIGRIRRSHELMKQKATSNKP